MRTVFIYALKDPRDGSVKYIGKTYRLSYRLSQHRRSKTRTYKDNWVRSLLQQGITPTLEVLDEVPDSQWEFFERAYIKVYREAGAKLTNLAEGGQGGSPMLGKKHSLRSRQKMSESLKAWFKGHVSPHLGRLASAETKAKQRAAKLGCKMPEETKSKLRGPRGPQKNKCVARKPFTKEHLENMSKAQQKICPGRPWSPARRAAYEASSKTSSPETRAKISAGLFAFNLKKGGK